MKENIQCSIFNIQYSNKDILHKIELVNVTSNSNMTMYQLIAPKERHVNPRDNVPNISCA